MNAQSAQQLPHHAARVTRASRLRNEMRVRQRLATLRGFIVVLFVIVTLCNSSPGSRHVWTLLCLSRRSAVGRI
jgi:hypothetical protein